MTLFLAVSFILFQSHIHNIAYMFCRYAIRDCRKTGTRRYVLPFQINMYLYVKSSSKVLDITI